MGNRLDDLSFAVVLIKVLRKHRLCNQDLISLHWHRSFGAPTRLRREMGFRLSVCRTRRQACAMPSHSKSANLITEAPAAMMTTALRSDVSMLCRPLRSEEHTSELQSL